MNSPYGDMAVEDAMDFLGAYAEGVSDEKAVSILVSQIPKYRQEEFWRDALHLLLKDYDGDIVLSAKISINQGGYA